MNDADNNRHCPLCLSAEIEKLDLSFKKKEFLCCSHCFLMFVDRGSLPDAQKEKERYLLHQNYDNKSGYISFLEKAILPLLPFINSNDIGLDYGCGPSKTLSDLFLSYGIQCDVYDPFFYPEINESEYDFIVSTEVFEHFHFPGKEIEKLISILKCGGYLVVMTELWDKKENLHLWYYIRDITHVSFYHHKTLKYLAQTYNLEIIYMDDERVVVFQKK